MLLGALLITAAAGAGETIPWTRDQDKAFADAGERRGPVILLFTGPDCGGKAMPGDLSRAAATDAPVPTTQDFQDKCERMEDEVLSRPDVVAAAARFVPVISDQGPLSGAIDSSQDRNLTRRYKVGTLPTVLFADPWGNEIIRLVGRTPKDAFLRVLNAIPSEFSALENSGKLLQQDPDNASALVGAAGFYADRGLLPVSDRLYEKALATKELKADAATRRPVVISRAMGLMRLDKTAEAAKLFEATLAEAPDGPQSDALMFGWMMAELLGARPKQARAVYANLEKRFPASPYTAKAKQNLETALKR